jgi:hypothetical protein
MDPGRYRSMVAELFANAGRMGPRQLGFIRRAFTEIYIHSGVLTGDPAVQAEYVKKVNPSTKEEDWVPNPWSVVVDEKEKAAIEAIRSEYGLHGDIQPGAKLSTLDPLDLQALAVYRSKRLGINKVV